MMKRLQHRFVEFIPSKLKEDVLYVSMEYATAIHLCVCGCGNEVVTPFSKTDWEISFDGEAVTLDPSIGNWNFSCRSHYWIRDGNVIWTKAWSTSEINQNRFMYREIKEEHYSKASNLSWCRRLKKWFS